MYRFRRRRSLAGCAGCARTARSPDGRACCRRGLVDRRLRALVSIQLSDHAPAGKAALEKRLMAAAASAALPGGQRAARHGRCSSPARAWPRSTLRRRRAAGSSPIVRRYETQLRQDARSRTDRRSGSTSATAGLTGQLAPHSGSSRLLRRDPAVDLLLQDRQRQRAGHQHLGVEFADVELVAELRLRLVAQPLDGQRADLVGQRLARNGDVALDLGRRVGLRPCRNVSSM